MLSTYALSHDNKLVATLTATKASFITAISVATNAKWTNLRQIFLVNPISTVDIGVAANSRKKRSFCFSPYVSPQLSIVVAISFASVFLPSTSIFSFVIHLSIVLLHRQIRHMASIFSCTFVYDIVRSQNPRYHFNLFINVS